MTSRIVYYGPVIQSRTLLDLDVWPSAVIAVGPDGIISWVESGPVASAELQDVCSKHGWDITDSASAVQLVQGHEGEWLMPGLVDTHSHAPQFPNLGTGQQYQLLDWLDNITFPTEARFADVAYARTAYTEVVSRVLNAGTTTCSYYATLHLEASKVLADVAHAKGQRAFIGKCNMDRNSPPTYIEASTESSLEDTKAIVDYIKSLHTASSARNSLPLVQPILTPRFAISCTPDLLEGVGKLYNTSPSSSFPPLLLQTHISENKAEITTTIDLFKHLPPHNLVESGAAPHHPHEHSYSSVYDHYGLLRERTILAHGVHLTEGELELIKTRNAGLSHCAGSNFNLRSGVASVGDWLDRGLKVGLGTDVSGGFAPSIVTEIRHASIASKVRAMMNAMDPSNHISQSSSPFTSPQGLPVATLLHMATLGGAAVCNLSDHIGSFAPGKQFDALYISLRKGGNPAVWHEVGRGDALEKQLERFLFCGDDRNIRNVWVSGRLVAGAEHVVT
ncbi:Metallo-dependent hydrolase [Clavulina sp. PMI_390]|nr:Metallo-dependent hydrolase [Clavulina sp. PMI_390]